MLKEERQGPFLPKCPRVQNEKIYNFAKNVMVMASHVIGDAVVKVKNKREKDKIRTKPDKNGKRGEAGKSQKQLQSVEEEN
nr:hypothetical protein [Tanacetum cinerariifolium]